MNARLTGHQKNPRQTSVVDRPRTCSEFCPCARWAQSSVVPASSAAHGGGFSGENHPRFRCAKPKGSKRLLRPSTRMKVTQRTVARASAPEQVAILRPQHGRRTHRRRATPSCHQMTAITYARWSRSIDNPRDGDRPIRRRQVSRRTDGHGAAAASAATTAATAKTATSGRPGIHEIDRTSTFDLHSFFLYL